MLIPLSLLAQNNTGFEETLGEKRTTIGNWSVSFDKSLMDKTERITMVNRAAVGDNTVGLIIREQEGELDVYVSTGEFLSTQALSVDVRFDDQPVVSQNWSVSTDYKAVFSPNPAIILKAMVNKKEMAFRIVPHGESPLTVLFYLEGIDQIAPLLIERATGERVRVVEGPLPTGALTNSSSGDTNGFRTWSTKSAEMFMGRYIKLENGIVFIELEGARVRKVPLNDLLSKDRKYVAEQAD